MDVMDMPLRPGRDVRDTVIDGQAILMDYARGIYVGLDDIGTEIWQLIRNASTGVRIAQHLHRKYDVAETRAHLDVERFLHELHTRGLIARCGTHVI